MRLLRGADATPLGVAAGAGPDFGPAFLVSCRRWQDQQAAPGHVSVEAATHQDARSCSMPYRRGGAMRPRGAFVGKRAPRTRKLWCCRRARGGGVSSVAARRSVDSEHSASSFDSRRDECFVSCAASAGLSRGREGLTRTVAVRCANLRWAENHHRSATCKHVSRVDRATPFGLRNRIEASSILRVCILRRVRRWHVLAHWACLAELPVPYALTHPGDCRIRRTPFDRSSFRR